MPGGSRWCRAAGCYPVPLGYARSIRALAAMKVYSTTIEPEDFEKVKQNAEKAWLNGKSHIRSSDREQYGMEDQLVGQMGEYALAKWLGVLPSYFSRREIINLNPWKGDEGSDVDGMQIDVKTSLMRRQKDPSRYNLLVRPRERHNENIYVLALIPDIQDGKVLLVGWLRDSELPTDPVGSGVFAGAFLMPATNLNDMKSLPA